MAGETVWIIVTSAVRTDDDLRRLAALYGWTVRRRCRTQLQTFAKFGGIAADIVAVLSATRRVPRKRFGTVCRRHFDWVKDDYNDGTSMRTTAIARFRHVTGRMPTVTLNDAIHSDQGLCCSAPCWVGWSSSNSPNSTRIPLRRCEQRPRPRSGRHEHLRNLRARDQTSREDGKLPPRNGGRPAGAGLLSTRPTEGPISPANSAHLPRRLIERLVRKLKS